MGIRGKRKKYYYSYDPYKKKIERLQDYLIAREQTSKGVKTKFGFTPCALGRLLHLKDGTFPYEESAIDIMLDHFQEAANPMCGSKC